MVMGKAWARNRAGDRLGLLAVGRGWAGSGVCWSEGRDVLCLWCGLR